MTDDKSCKPFSALICHTSHGANIICQLSRLLAQLELSPYLLRSPFPGEEGFFPVNLQAPIENQKHRNPVFAYVSVPSSRSIVKNDN